MDLTDTNPDETYSSVPYIKGQNFLRYIEDTLGGPAVFEPFLRYYINKYKYQSIVTEDFKNTLYEYFEGKADDQLKEIDWDLWLYGEGMPPIIPKYDTSILDAVNQQAEIWNTSNIEEIKNNSNISKDLTILQKIELLTVLVQNPNEINLSEEWVCFLEETYNLIGTKNSEILFGLSRLYVKGRLLNRIDKIFEFLNSNFRMKYVRPIYRALNQWTEARPLAIDNFNKVKLQMMKCCALAVAKDLDVEYIE